MSTEPLNVSAVGSLIVSWTEGRVVVEQADDAIEVTAEVAEMHGVKPPLDGRVTLWPGYTYDLSGYVGTPAPLGRHPGTYLGVRVRP